MIQGAEVGNNDPYKVEINGADYQCVLGSDIQRDGMYLELSRSDGTFVLEVFYSDETSEMTLTTHEEGVSLGVVERLIAQAKIRLPPPKA